MKKISVFHLDDDPLILESIIGENLKLAEFEIVSFEKVQDFIAAVDTSNPDIALVDLHLGNDEDGISVIQQVRKKSGKTIVIALSNDLKMVRKALEFGAHDFISKLADPSEVVLRIANTFKFLQGMKVAPPLGKTHVIGNVMKSIAARVPNIINSAVTSVYIHGESGTGKEVVAQLFEDALGNKKPFIKVNCGAISETLLERELFGHAKGSFTGATADRPGFIEAASGGWIFLDEIALLSQAAQAALLRAIENHEIVRVGDNKPIHVDFKVISASNVHLQTLVESGKFRNDLWQRICEIRLELPPLRDRLDDISEYIDYFAKTLSGGPYLVPAETKAALTRISWSNGNIRELRNCLRSMTEKQLERVLTPMSIPQNLMDPPNEAQATSVGLNSISISYSDDLPSFAVMTDHLLIELLKVIRKRDGGTSLRQAGEGLGMPKSTLESRIKSAVAHGIISQSQVKTLFREPL